MVSFLSEVKFFIFWPKTMDYNKAFWPKLSSLFVVLLLRNGRCYKAETCAILLLLRCSFRWYPYIYHNVCFFSRLYLCSSRLSTLDTMVMLHCFTYSLLLVQCCVEMGDHQTMHGDGVKDIAFAVENCRALFEVSSVCMPAALHVLLLVLCLAESSCSRGQASERAVGGD